MTKKLLGSHFFLVCALILSFQILISEKLYSQEELTALPKKSPIIDFVFLTGRVDGTYYPVGMSIKRAIEKGIPEIQILCEPSHGSLDNARLLVSDKADLAIIQSDIAYYLYTGSRIFSLPSDKINGICPLYVEAVHVVTRNDSGIKLLRDLKGKIVSVGQKDSGSEFNTRVILDTLNITYGDITPVYEPLDESIDLLKRNKIDALFVTTKVPILSLKHYFEDLDLTLISFHSNEIERIIKAYPYFVSKKIAAFTYPNQNRDVFTLGVRALFLVHAYENKRKVYQITKALYANKEIVEEAHPNITLDPKEAATRMPVPLHSGARDYYKEIGVIQKPTIFYYMRIVFIVFVIISIILALFRLYPNQSKVVLGNIYFRFFAFLFLLIFLGSWGLFRVEKQINENFNSISQSLWSCIVYLFSGFEDRAPISSLGKVISVFIFLLGVSIFGLVSGKFASYFVDKALKKEKKMPRNINQHIMICNWNNRAEHIVNEIYNADTNIDISILTDIDIENEKELHKKEAFKKVHFARGDPAFHDRLENCNIQCAKSIIILANEKSQDPDAQSALIALAISKVCGEEKPHIIAEALNHRKTHHLKDAGVDELVCATDYGTGLIAQAALHPGLTKVYDRLLSYSGITNEIYVIKSENVPPILKKDISFSEASQIINQNRDPKNPVLLLGVMRNGEPIINPKREQSRINSSDDLLVLSYSQPDISEIK